MIGDTDVQRGQRPVSGQSGGTSSRGAWSRQRREASAAPGAPPLGSGAAGSRCHWGQLQGVRWGWPDFPATRTPARFF